MQSIKVVFFGTPKYSIIVLDKLIKAGYQICCCVTKPAAKIGREQKLTPTAVYEYAKKNNLPVLTPLSNPHKPLEIANITQLKKELENYKSDILIAADYTQKIPQEIVKIAPLGGINIHPSFLPFYRGPAPVPWAIHNGEVETGISLITLSDKFDQGEIIVQAKEKILDNDTTDILLTRLFNLGADLLIKTLPNYSLKSIHNSSFIIDNSSSYFPRLTRDMGYEPWEKIMDPKEAQRIDRKFRAFHPWPGLWTVVKVKSQKSKGKFEEKRMKILDIKLKRITPTSNNLSLISYRLLLDTIQLEGKQPISGKDAQNFLKQIG